MYNLHSASLQVLACVRPKVPNTPNYQLNMLVYESQSQSFGPMYFFQSQRTDYAEKRCF